MIVEELRRALTEGMATEQQVVYLLVEIRKLLELRDEKETLRAQPVDATLALSPLAGVSDR